MKLTTLSIFLLLLTTQILTAQSSTDCKDHPLFSTMSNHKIAQCAKKEFEKLVLYRVDKTKGKIEFQKEGEYDYVSYRFEGDWDKRPSFAQIGQNYINAIQKAGGQILYKGDAVLYGTMKKNTNTYWIKVETDGSGYYGIESLKEAALRQDIVMTAEEIKNNIAEEGKAIFYGIYFDIDKATVKSESAAAISEIANYLKINPAIKVFIVGHTDNTGTNEVNRKLSKDRADAVINELVTKYTVPGSQLLADGVGPLCPVATNKTEEGRARNRRVEMVLQ
jgi:outer membrane protein OmpA-like peptidoglycan-associated protein